MIETAVPQQSLKRRIWNWLKVLLAILLLGYVISQTDLQQLRQVWETLSQTWLLASIACFVLMVIVKAFQYRALINPRLSYWNVLNIIILQNAISNFISNAAGVVSYMSMFRAEHGVKLPRSAVTFIIVKVGDLMSILFLLVSSLLFVWPTVSVLHVLLLALSIGIFISLGVFFATVFYRHWFVGMLRRLFERLRLVRFSLVQRGLTLLGSLSEQDPAVINGLLLRGVLYSGLYFACTITWSYALIRAFHIPIDFTGMVFVSAVRQIISFLPIQVFGGLGVTEVSSLYLYGLFSIPLPELSAALLGIRVYNTILNGLTLLYIPFGRSKE
jgi:uncharacterized membrane protein YbhN (UPF0104 family)